MKRSLFLPALLTLLTALGTIPATAGAQSAPFRGSDPCTALTVQVSTHIHLTNHDERTIRLSDAACEVSVRMRGTIEFTDDFRGIATVSPGGEFRLEESTRVASRRLVIESDGRGVVEAHYRVDGANRSFDAETREWLAARLQLLYRRAGLAAEERAPWVLARSGLDGLLAEAAQVHGSTARSTYLELALRQPQMDARRATQLLRTALPTSSSGRAEILLVVAERYPMQGAFAEAYLEAAGGISSTSARRRALAAPLAGGRASRDYVLGVLRAADDISSSGERSRLLAQIAGEYSLDDAQLTAYLDAASGISSSSARRDALGAVLTEQRLDTRQLTRVVRSAEGIASSSARADVLVNAASSQPFEGAARTAYLEVASSISSRPHRDRAIRALEQAARR